jgi:hypothetical protein
MKISAVFVALFASVSAFAPIKQPGRSATELDALADRIFGMDLFAPNVS